MSRCFFLLRNALESGDTGVSRGSTPWCRATPAVIPHGQCRVGIAALLAPPNPRVRLIPHALHPRLLPHALNPSLTQTIHPRLPSKSLPLSLSLSLSLSLCLSLSLSLPLSGFCRARGGSLSFLLKRRYLRVSLRCGPSRPTSRRFSGVSQQALLPSGPESSGSCLAEAGGPPGGRRARPGRGNSLREPRGPRLKPG